MSKDDAWWLKVAYVSFFLVMAFCFYKAIETLGIQTGWMERFEWFSYVCTAGAFVLAGAATWTLKADKDRDDYLLQAIAELRKVTWPTWADTKRMTYIVVIVCGIFAVIVGIFDVVWAKALKLLLA